MKKKIVLWGHNDQDEKILVALELLAEKNKVGIHTFPEEIVTKEFETSMMDAWRTNKEIAFPEGSTSIERELQLSESLLPDNIKVVKTDLINITKTEWAVYVLSVKLYKSFESELDELKDQVEELSEFSKDKWEEMKTFWNRVQGQVRDRNIYREQANELKNTTNELFEKLKVLRNKMDGEFKNVSKVAYEEIGNLLESVEQKIEKGVGLNDLFNQLKKIQDQYTGKKFTKEHRNKLWTRLDKAYKDLKQKKYGDGAFNDNSAANRLKKRMEGLDGAIQRMESSIRRDQSDYDFHMGKNDASYSQLEIQLREAKLTMVKERLNSKKTKLDDMLKTKIEVTAKIEKAEQQDVQRKQKAANEKAKKEAAQKIAAAKIAESKTALEASKEALETASEKIKAESKVAPKAAKAKVAPVPTEEALKTETPAEEVPKAAAENAPTEEPLKTEATVEEAPKAEATQDKTPEEVVEDVIDKVEDVIEVVVDKVEDVIEEAVETVKKISSILGDTLDELIDKK